MVEESKLRKFRAEFGSAVRKRRHKLNLSQEAFADKANVHRTYVSSIELGKADIGMGAALRIADALNIPLNRLVKETEKNI